jgi:RNA polymerase sigma-70 factor (ECF subfamily)
MDLDFPSPHLGRISTPWTLLRLAHADSEASGDAKRLLVQRYCGAVYRYLLGALRDEQAALELFQEFALRFLRGDFHRADAQAGRFRDYLRGALIHLVTDYHRQRRAQPRPLPADIAERAVQPAEGLDSEVSFLQSWREELVNRAWKSLQEANPIYHAVLVSHVENPDMSARRIAESLATRLQKPFSAGQVRVTLHRARAKFAELLLDEVAHSLGDCSVFPPVALAYAAKNPDRVDRIMQLSSGRLPTAWRQCRENA